MWHCFPDANSSSLPIGEPGYFSMNLEKKVLLLFAQIQIVGLEMVRDAFLGHNLGRIVNICGKILNLPHLD